ncbi:hypothetical protein Pan44_01410 [Caulifigura coniformis]|uniref:GATA-type domain-containing protein n=1 Tax=Caulifigura coniformis TaxID=2527983 RepID=A0A517S7M6_9PLAN|nr:hypothetical protein [Caulifigura coniformis]QDT52132.1 hypothetical protein Pan44_01410 [Caulifigura coniformis]
MARLIGIVPLGIGLSALMFAWSSEFGGGFGVPIFFRLFFSFIALAFVMAGAGTLFAGLKGGAHSGLINRALDLQQQLQAEMRARGMTPPIDQETTNEPRMSSEGYLCPSCNAPIGSRADVSPHGDVKCQHCGRWFNVHG